ncbi:MAG: hypothetical protein ACM3MI_05750 [Clostridiales bacterium]
MLFSDVAAGDHTISTKIEISQTAINRFLNTQYNAAGFPRSIPVSYGGTNYTIALGLPEIILTQGNAKLQMVFDVNSPTANIYHFLIQPSVIIPSSQITGAQVQAFLNSLPTELEKISSIPQWVKDPIIQTYKDLGFTVFPSKPIDKLNSTLFEQQSINVISPYFSLGWEVTDGNLNLLVSTFLNSSLPDFRLNIGGYAGINDSLYVKSNKKVRVNSVKITDIPAKLIKFNGNPNVYTNKNKVVGIDLGNGDYPSYSYMIVQIVFIDDNTWYCAEYPSVGVNLLNADRSLIFYGPALKTKTNF